MTWTAVTSIASRRRIARAGPLFRKNRAPRTRRNRGANRAARTARIDAHTVRSVALEEAKRPPGFQGRHGDARRTLARVGDRARGRGRSGYQEPRGAMITAAIAITPASRNTRVNSVKNASKSWLMTARA